MTETEDRLDVLADELERLIAELAEMVATNGGIHARES